MSIKQCFVLIFTLAASDIAMSGAIAVFDGTICNNAIQKTTPDEAFTLHDNGTVTHQTTGLMWMRCLLGQTWDGANCSSAAQTYSWQNALQTAETHTFAGYNDWRLPNKNELASIVEEACINPAINTLAFPNTPTWAVWSSSPYADYSYGAWLVGFGYGDVGFNSKPNDALVRLVRGGQ